MTLVMYSDPKGGFLTFPELSDELRRAAYPNFEFRQFVRHLSTPALRGSVVYFPRVGRVLEVVKPITEYQQVPALPPPTISRGMVEIEDYWAKLSFSERLERLSDFDVRQIVIDQLQSNMTFNLDCYVAATFKKTPIVAVPTTATTITFVDRSKGETVPQAGARALTSAHVRTIIDYMRGELQVPPYDGTNYVCIAHIGAIRTLYDEIGSEFLKYTSPEFFYRNEVAQWYGCRFVQTNNRHALAALAGTGPVKTPEAIFLAHDPAVEVISVLEEIRAEAPHDFGREQELAWFFSGGWSLTWDTGMDHPGQQRVIYVTSG